MYDTKKGAAGLCDREGARPRHSEVGGVPAAPALRIHLFGSFEAWVEGQPLPRLRSRKGHWLLALLALREGRAVQRAWVAGTLWPETTEENALISLRQTLADLRRALGREGARIQSPTTRTLVFDASDAFVDVLAFDAALREGDPASLARAVALQERPLLEDCLEEWALPEREARSQAGLTARQTLAASAMAQGDFAVAVAHLRRIVAADPFHEVAQRDLMNALAGSGDWGAMLLAYRDLRLMLQRELRAEPAAETRALYDRLRAEARRRNGGLDSPAASEGPAAAPLPERASPFGLLPRPLTGLVGREQEVKAVSGLLFSARLVTLTGPGGVGKTRLAIRVAEAWAEDQPDGVWFVDLAPLTDPSLVPRSVAAALGVPEKPGAAPSDTLAEALRQRRLLLILDNCEHLLGACAALASRLLGDCPAVRLLATSRQSLGLMGESVWPVPSLSVPTAKEGGSLDAVAGTDAVRLFVERAASVLPGFELTARNAPAVSQVCRRLDGIPLAIELAAARSRMLSPEQIAVRLDDRFRLLTQGNRAALPRQQTLRAAVDWSYDLLSEPERLLLARLSVFTGGWTLEAAEAVCALEDDEADVLDLLTALEERSLVSVVADDRPERRYRLLETFRQYAGERLEAAGQTGEIARRHREWAVRLSEAADAHCRGPEANFWRDRLEADHDNLRSALEGSPPEGRKDEEEADSLRLRLAAALWRFWMDRGHYREGLACLGRVLARSSRASQASTRNKALNGAAALAWHQGDLASSRRWMEEALLLARESGETRSLDNCLHNLGNVLYSQRDYGAARSYWEESLAIRRGTANQALVAASLNNLGSLACDEGELEQAGVLHAEALALALEHGNSHSRQSSLAGMGSVAKRRGDLAGARSYFEQSLTLAQGIGDKDAACGALIDLGGLALAEGNAHEAGLMLRAGLEIARDAGLTPLTLDALDGQSEQALARGLADRAAALSGASEAQRQALRLPRTLASQSRHEESAERLRTLLAPMPPDTAMNRGRSLTLEEAVALGMEAA